MSDDAPLTIQEIADIAARTVPGSQTFVYNTMYSVDVPRLLAGLQRAHDERDALQAKLDVLTALLNEIAYEDRGGKTFYYIYCKFCNGNGKRNNLSVETVKHRDDCKLQAALKGDTP